MRGKGRISFVLVPDLIVTSRQNRKWQGSLLADSNQTKTSTNTNQKAGTCDIRLEKETLRILRDTYHVFMVIPNFLVQTYPSHSRLQLVSTERFFCWKILALVAAAIYIWANVGECPFALLSAPILRATLCGREKGRLINFIFILASPLFYHLVVHLFRTEPVETRKGLVQGRTITLLGGESDLFKVCRSYSSVTI